MTLTMGTSQATPESAGSVKVRGATEPSSQVVFSVSTSAAVRTVSSAFLVQLIWSVSAGSGSFHLMLLVTPTGLHSSRGNGAEGFVTLTMGTSQATPESTRRYVLGLTVSSVHRVLAVSTSDAVRMSPLAFSVQLIWSVSAGSGPVQSMLLVTPTGLQGSSNGGFSGMITSVIIVVVALGGGVVSACATPAPRLPTRTTVTRTASGFLSHDVMRGIDVSLLWLVMTRFLTTRTRRTAKTACTGRTQHWLAMKDKPPLRFIISYFALNASIYPYFTRVRST